MQIHTDNIEGTIATLLENKVSLQGMQVKSATLDDLFLKLTGHALHKTEEVTDV